MLTDERPVLPFAAQIYDYETEELQNILDKITLHLKSQQPSSKISDDETEWIEKATYIRQLIQTEIAERNDVISFGNMCMNYKPSDNPFDFLKKFDDFNRQLQKLALQEDKKTQSTQERIPTSTTISRQQLTVNISQCLTDKSVKLGLNNKKRNSDTKEMMMKLLQRTQVSTKVVIGKSTQTKKAQLQQQNHKISHQQPKHTEQPTKMPLRKEQTSGDKKTEQKKNDALKTLDKIQKKQQHTEHKKPMSNKDLVEFVRMEEKEKKKLQVVNNKGEDFHVKEEVPSITKICEQPIQQQIQENIPKSNKQQYFTEQEHKKEDKGQEINKLQVHQQITKVPLEIQIDTQNDVKHSQLDVKPTLNLIFHQPTQKTQSNQQTEEDIKEDIKQQEESDTEDKKSPRPRQLKGRLIRTSTASSKKSSTTFSQPQISSDTQKTFKLASPEEFINIVRKVDSSDQDGHIEQKQVQFNSKPMTLPVKNCYSEDYWNTVKKQAEENLENVKKMNEQRDLQRVLINDQVNKAMAEIQQYKEKAKEIIEKQKQEKQEKCDQEKPTTHQQKIETVETDQPKQKKPAIKLKKVKKQEPPVSVVTHPLPQHIQNYLQHFASFNHIFSVYYLKPSAEAILDINIIMKQLYAIFSIHKDVMASNNYRKPLFTPFDNFNTVYINEPRQLLNHAQTTHVDIKNMISRLSVFNENIHGRFDDDRETMHYRVVRNRQEVYDIVTTTFLRLKGWRELPHGMNLRTSWNLFWTWAKPELDLNKLLAFQKINHFPLNKNLCRKDLLYKNMQSFKKQFKVQIPFLPITFNLPKQFSQFSVKFHEDQIYEHQNNIWIMKPIGKSRGRGIKLVNNIVDISYHDNIVVQKYIKNPLLLDGYKFDMRIYVLVTSIHPLQVFLYREGFARLSTEKFSMNVDSIKNTFIHLTNFAIQKNNREAAVNFEGGSKISLKTLEGKLESMGINWQLIWGKVQDIIVKSLMACTMGMPRFPSAFQLFGYDIMINSELDCFLIEVNSSPSLERSYMIDEIIKQTLIDDIIELLDPPSFDRDECCQVFTERLARKNPTTNHEDNIDIARILKFKPLRKVGEMPKKMGLFQRIAPDKKYQELERQVEAKFNPNIRYLDN